MITLSNDQKLVVKAFTDFIKNPDIDELAIQGKAGTGKTFLTKYLVDTLKAKNKLSKMLTGNSINSFLDIYFTACTNKAAEVLSKSVNANTSTIHSLLNLTMYDNYKTGKTTIKQRNNFNPIYNSLIIIDEASMLDLKLLEIIRNSFIDCKILYILDKDQLPPIGENICCIPKEVKNTIQLKSIQRQAKNSPIIQFGEDYRKVLDGQQFPKINTDGKVIRRVSPNEWRQLIEEEFSSKNHSIHSAKILAYTNDAVNKANTFVRNLYTKSKNFEVGEYVVTNNPIINAKGKMLHKTDSILRVNDIEDSPVKELGILSWVIYIENTKFYLPVNYDDLKREKTRINRENNKIRKAGKYPNYSRHFALKNNFVDLRSVHASTIHKSQGSTYDTVFLNLNDIGLHFNRENLARSMYVAITRAAKKIIMVGRLGGHYGDA